MYACFTEIVLIVDKLARYDWLKTPKYRIGTTLARKDCTFQHFLFQSTFLEAFAHKFTLCSNFKAESFCLEMSPVYDFEIVH